MLKTTAFYLGIMSKKTVVDNLTEGLSELSVKSKVEIEDKMKKKQDPEDAEGKPRG